MKVPHKTRDIAPPGDVAEFSFTKAVLAFDDVIGWIEKRQSMPGIKKTPELLEVLRRYRRECSAANSTKPMGWD
jgi:hypothetical protein